MDLTHEQARQLAQKNLQSRLDDFERAALETHLAGCADCAAYGDEIRSLDRRMAGSLNDRWPERRTNPAQVERALAKIQTRLRRESMFRNLSTAVRLAGTALVLIVLIAGLAWVVNGTTRGPDTVGGKTRPTLPAGSPTAAQTGKASPTPAQEPNRMALAEAEKLVRGKIFKDNPMMNPEAQFPLVEITTDELWQRMHAQLFKVSDGVRVGEAYLARGGRIWNLGIAFGGQGVDTNLLVTDLDGDGSSEMLYTYSFGSGISHGGLGIVYGSETETHVLEPQQTWVMGSMRLIKVSEQEVKVEALEDGHIEWQTKGVVSFTGGQLRVVSENVPTALYTSDRYGLSLLYPKDWQAAGEDHFQGADGFFQLMSLGTWLKTEDMTRSCEWVANNNPSHYGDQPQIQWLQVAQQREMSAGGYQSDVCLILTSLSSGSPDRQSAAVFTAPNGEIGLLTVDADHAGDLFQSLRFSQTPKANTSEVIDMTPRAPAAGGKLETRSLGDLTLSEYAVVKASEDTPSHMEFDARIPKEILEGRNMRVGIDRYNQLLGPFGVRLEEKVNADGQTTYDLYQADHLLKGDLTFVWRPSVYQDEQGKGDFAMIVEDSQGRWLVRKDLLEPWDDMLHRYTRPVFTSGGLITAERNPDNETGSNDRVLIKQDGQVIFSYGLAPSAVKEAVKTLDEWNGGWVLEVDGTLIVSGANWNQKDFPADEIFNWTKIDGKPFFFFRRDGKTGAWYDGKELDLAYDEVVHGNCCEPGMFNVRNGEKQIAFYARKDGMWYFVKLGK